MTSHFVLAPCVRFGYNSLNYCWLCDEILLLSCCAARDTHFSAFIIVVDILVAQAFSALASPTTDGWMWFMPGIVVSN